MTVLSIDNGAKPCAAHNPRQIRLSRSRGLRSVEPGCRGGTPGSLAGMQLCLLGAAPSGRSLSRIEHAEQITHIGDPGEHIGRREPQ